MQIYVFTKQNKTTIDFESTSLNCVLNLLHEKIGMRIGTLACHQSASGSDGPWFQPWQRLKIYQIRNDVMYQQILLGNQRQHIVLGLIVEIRRVHTFNKKWYTYIHRAY